MRSIATVFAFLRHGLGVLAVFLLFSTQLWPQNSTGRIVGTITDAHGTAMAGAKITVTPTGTNVRSETSSAADGSYQVLDLPVGSDSVTAEHEKKTILFGEKVQMTFRAESFNIFNHTEFQNPSGGPQSIFSPQLG